MEFKLNKSVTYRQFEVTHEGTTTYARTAGDGNWETQMGDAWDTVTSDGKLIRLNAAYELWRRQWNLDSAEKAIALWKYLTEHEPQAEYIIVPVWGHTDGKRDHLVYTLVAKAESDVFLDSQAEYTAEGISQITKGWESRGKDRSTTLEFHPTTEDFRAELSAYKLVPSQEKINAHYGTLEVFPPLPD